MLKHDEIDRSIETNLRRASVQEHVPTVNSTEDLGNFVKQHQRRLATNKSQEEVKT
jgi:hypothetical protein